jgi:acetyl-CoA C-acetyltransferase
VAIVGVSDIPSRVAVRDRSLEEMIFEVAQSALRDAKLSIEDVDTVVISANDQRDGRVISSMVTAGAVGAVGRDLTTIPSAGEHAFIYAYLRLRAGLSRVVLALAWSKPSEGVDPAHAELVSAEPFYLRPIGMNDTIAAALHAAAYRRRFPIDDVSIAGTVVDRYDRAIRNPRAGVIDPVTTDDVLTSPLVAWPLRRLELPAMRDGAFGAVLTGEPLEHDMQPAWIRSIGWAADAYELGARDLSHMRAVADAADRAYAAASIDDPARQVDVVEVQELSSIGAVAACRALRLGPSDEPATPSGSRTIVNPSGGSLPSSPPHAAGFARVVEAALQVQGRAGPVQVTPTPATAVACGIAGFAGQLASVFVLANTPGRER